jgi:hypothetical protein
VDYHVAKMQVDDRNIPFHVVLRRNPANNALQCVQGDGNWGDISVFRFKSISPPKSILEAWNELPQDRFTYATREIRLLSMAI